MKTAFRYGLVFVWVGFLSCRWKKWDAGWFLELLLGYSSTLVAGWVVDDEWRDRGFQLVQITAKCFFLSRAHSSRNLHTFTCLNYIFLLVFEVTFAWMVFFTIVHATKVKCCSVLLFASHRTNNRSSTSRKLSCLSNISIISIKLRVLKSKFSFTSMRQKQSLIHNRISGPIIKPNNFRLRRRLITSTARLP